MCEHGQHGGERAKARCEEDEEGELFLWVHRYLMERWSGDREKKGLLRSGERARKADWKRSTHTAEAPYLLSLCTRGRGKISDLSPAGRGLTGML